MVGHPAVRFERVFGTDLDGARPVNDYAQDAINNLAGRSDVLDAVMKVVAQDFIYLMVPVVIGLWFWPVGETRALNQRVAFLACVSALAALALGVLLGDLYYQDRPFVFDHATRLLVNHATDNSFPSDHTTVAFAVAGALIVWRRLLGMVLVATALALGLARVYVGVHWPSDVAAGATIGFCVGLVASLGESLLRPAQAYLHQLLPDVLVADPN